MTTKLALYNKAGAHLKQERVGLDDDVLLVRELDAVYDEVLEGCLEEGYWNWAIRVVQISYDAEIDTSGFGGLEYGYSLPDDMVSIVAISSSAYFTPDTEVTNYELNGPGTLLYTHLDTIYLKYISDGASYGLNLGQWSETFANAVGARLAQAVAMRVTKSDKDEATCEAKGNKLIAQAKIRDAVNQSVKGKPTGRLVRARIGFRRPRTLRDFNY